MSYDWRVTVKDWEARWAEEPGEY